jgi:hypothetical protein
MHPDCDRRIMRDELREYRESMIESGLVETASGCCQPDELSKAIDADSQITPCGQNSQPSQH